MAAAIQIISHICITLAAVVGLALRVEHRLTKIETDVAWLKKNMGPFCKGDSDNEQDNDMDSS